ncbi:hypothetical protein EIN_217880 [Entamoeba invadens IP1]|uniref:Uncharacterized protein n=1 Tax=Entamoeba invadens IP1 TaxID=370355 RepID=L7FNT0_ENTIV|nr:hypothetical protein EIN_217880 [Entamoeba invadens IP1]ELP95323.1 hypothetical protein EIN_217880 [Entamoeba invadens IP1]|eukprot:XP_004262094.1 hypothetical protein EIN_217880 [Entamoeba invadens IP1]
MNFTTRLFKRFVVTQRKRRVQICLNTVVSYIKHFLFHASTQWSSPKHFISVSNECIKIISNQIKSDINLQSHVSKKKFKRILNFLEMSRNTVRSGMKKYEKFNKERITEQKYENLYQEFVLFSSSNGDYLKIKRLYDDIENVNEKNYPFLDLTISVLFGLY